MTEKKKSWRRSAAWVTELRTRPLRSANFKLTAIYVVLTTVILIIFLTALHIIRIETLEDTLRGQLINRANENILIEQLAQNLGQAALLLSLFVLLSISTLSYMAVNMTLKPIRIFLEGHRRFIADASHELRTPLATMRTEIEVAMLDPDSITKKEMVEILESNVEEIDRMSKILTNLLNLASFNDASGEPPMTVVDLKEVVEESILRVNKTADLKGVEILSHNVESVKVMGNMTALEEVAFNLLKNAIYYSHDNGTVAITLRESNDKFAELIIKDQGVGISPNDLQHIFEPFYRSEHSFHMHKTGSGLGLPIVKEMVKKHKGSVHVESSPGKGTAVIVHLPLAIKIVERS